MRRLAIALVLCASCGTTMHVNGVPVNEPPKQERRADSGAGTVALVLVAILLGIVVGGAASS